MVGVQPREEKTAAGIGMMVLAVALFTCIDTSAKWLLIAGLPALQVVFARYAGHLIVALLIYLPQEGRNAVRSNSPKLQFLRSVCLLGSTILNFLALSYLPITLTTTIQFTIPIIVTMLAIPILREKVGIRRIIAICVGFSGVLVVTQPWGAVWQPAMLLSIASVTVASLYFVLTRRLAGIETNATQQVWSSAVATAVLLPLVLRGWTWPPDLMAWAVFCGIGFFGATGHIAATTAHRWADASLLSPMFYTQIVFAAFAGIVVFSTWPTIYTLSGGAIIIASGLYIWARERKVKGG
ncbi:DMT family transporter [Marivita sp. XM-24bin2]|uniref:DMT family transporter n=1 Tax=unclassified Marivita TaxID=2632480 RepID=UPI0025C11CE9|nr:DMT family transporter [Marivita sp. XM-24bin2]MCR9110217.1 DMT family transporter [Paracoccaceae bacterium]